MVHLDFSIDSLSLPCLNWKTWEVAPVFMKQNLSARGTAARRSVLLGGWVPTVEVMILLSSAAMLMVIS